MRRKKYGRVTSVRDLDRKRVQTHPKILVRSRLGAFILQSRLEAIYNTSATGRANFASRVYMGRIMRE
jgi:hypothetical protein